MIQVIDYKDTYGINTHISSDIKVFIKHLIDTFRIEKYSSKPLTLQFDVKTDSGKIVVIDKYLWVKAEEYFTLIQMVNFNIDYITDLDLTYISCLKEQGTHYTSYYNAKYKFTFGDAPELFPSCEADVVSIKRDEFGVTKGIVVEKNNICQ